MFLHLSVSHPVQGGSGGGVCMQGGLHQTGVGRSPRPQQILWDSVNERAVRILPECILVMPYFLFFDIGASFFHHSQKVAASIKRACENEDKILDPINKATLAVTKKFLKLSCKSTAELLIIW